MLVPIVGEDNLRLDNEWHSSPAQVDTWLSQMFETISHQLI